MSAANVDIHYRTCNLCEAMCGIAIEVEDQQILSIKGDKNDPFSKGHICPKAVALKDQHEDPDRLRKPVMRTAEGWQEISWNKALDLVADNIKDTQAKHGRNAVGAYLGNPNVHHLGNMIFGGPFLSMLRTRNKFSATSNDQLPHMRVSLELFGHQLLLPVPDIDHTDLFILVGSNPAASNGSMMTAPDMLGRMKNVRRRGGEVILIDPRRTETAKVADQHIFVRPGTDAFLFLGMLHTLFDEDLVETGRLASSLNDLAKIRKMASEYSPELASELTGIDADQIKNLARKLANTPRAALFGRMGTSTQEFGTLATWLIYVLNLLTNHMDERGGLMFTKPAADVVELMALSGQKGSANRYQSNSGLPEFGGELPSSTMADQIEMPGKRQIKAMVVMAGNPVLSNPNGERLAKAMASLDFMVCIDSYINETSRLADVILPSTSQLERSHYDLIFNILAVRNVAKYSPALFEKPKGSRHDWEILLELTRRIEATDLTKRVRSEASYQVLKRLGPDGILDIMLRIGPYGTQIPGTSQIGAFIIDAMQDLFGPSHALRKLVDMGPYGAPNRSLSKGLCTSSLLNYPHGVDLGSLQSALPGRLYTKKKRIFLAPKAFLKDLDRLKERADDFKGFLQPDQLLMIGRRDLRSNNSWMHNSSRLMKGKLRCIALLHPNDADARGIEDGQDIVVESRIGELTIPVTVTDEVMPGVISVPHGWGHDLEGVQLSVAAKRPGVNVNAITDDTLVDKLGGTSALNGVPVSVRAKIETPVKTKKPTKGAQSTGRSAPKSKERVRVAAKLA